MSGMNVSGKIMIQEAHHGVFVAHVYQSRVDAAIQLLRVEIRRANGQKKAIKHIELQVAELVEHETRLLES